MDKPSMSLCIDTGHYRKQLIRWQKDRIATLEAQLKEREWISVEDRLPEERCCYYWTCNIEGKQEARFCSSTGFVSLIITHWMPLISPPITEKDNG